MLSTSGHHIILNTTHSRNYDSLTCKVLWLCMWHTVGWRLRTSCFWRRLWSEWFSATASPACFRNLEYSRQRNFCRRGASHGLLFSNKRVRDFRLLRCSVSICTRCYTAILTLTPVCRPNFTGHVDCSVGPDPCSYVYVYSATSTTSTTLYEACRNG